MHQADFTRLSKKGKNMPNGRSKGLMDLKAKAEFDSLCLLDKAVGEVPIIEEVRTSFIRN